MEGLGDWLWVTGLLPESLRTRTEALHCIWVVFAFSTEPCLCMQRYIVEGYLGLCRYEEQSLVDTCSLLCDLKKLNL
jgi:hypothetical protein